MAEDTLPIPLGPAPSGKEGISPKEVALIIKRAGDAEFRITGNPGEIGQIGDLLRGKSSFSWFNSVILPAGVTILTIVAGLCFQYIGWVNDVRIQATKDIVAKAEGVYSKATNAMDQFYYRTFVVVSAVQDLAIRKANAENSLTSTLIKLDNDRVEAYYSALGSWSIGYSQSLSDIEYAFDRPIFFQVKLPQDQLNRELKPVSWTQAQHADCTKSLVEQVRKLGYSSYNLKAQFAVISACYAAITGEYGLIKQKLIAGEELTLPVYNGEGSLIDKTALPDDIDKKLDNASTMTNVFRCYAEGRLHFYKRENDYAILSPQHLIEILVNWSPAARAKRELAGADDECDSYLGLRPTPPSGSTLVAATKSSP